MIKVDAVQLTVRDQDEARAFYVDKLGMEVRKDAPMPGGEGMRWLTVGPPEQPDLEVVLMGAWEPSGAGGGAIYLSTDDCFATCAELEQRDVELSEPPEEKPYGVVAALRDPSGNYIRLAQSR